MVGRGAIKARGRLTGRPEKGGLENIEMMKALIERGISLKNGLVYKCFLLFVY